jgi:hypothetical protein
MPVQNNHTLESMRATLRRIAVECDTSTASASALETMILRHFPEDERFDDILHILASYRPSGGAFMFDEAALKIECEHMLKLLGDGSE